MFYFTENRPKSLNGYTLILPSVSVGNVAQLTCDLLISNYEMTKIGSIHDDSFLPMVGNNPYTHPNSDTCDLITSCELYESTAEKIVLIQQRSPFVKGKRASFREKLSKWIKGCGFDQVIILTSSFAHERLDKQLIGPQQRYLASPNLEKKSGKLLRENLQWMELERRTSFPAPSAVNMQNGQGDGESIYIPGGGIAKSLYENCYESECVLMLITFCSEGDNAPDAFNLANYLYQYLQPETAVPDGGERLQKRAWKIPSSWRLAFGNRPDPMLFH